MLSVLQIFSKEKNESLEESSQRGGNQLAAECQADSKQAENHPLTVSPFFCTEIVLYRSPSTSKHLQVWVELIGLNRYLPGKHELPFPVFEQMFFVCFPGPGSPPPVRVTMPSHSPTGCKGCRLPQQLAKHFFHFQPT